MDVDIRDFSRIGHFHNGTLFEIATDSYLKLQSLRETELELRKKGTYEVNGNLVYKEHVQILEIQDILLKESIKVVVFLGAFLESYFFELSAVALGQQYTENHIEKMDLTSKMVIVPQLITGKKINTSQNFWGGIKTLIKWRNKIIHNKTKNATEYFEKIDLGNYDPKPLYEEFDIKTFFLAIKELFINLEEIDPEGVHQARFKSTFNSINL